jgi:hypothetical protein
MITHYTVRFGAAVSQKDLEKALNESGETPTHDPDIREFKARIEFIADFEDVKKVAETVKRLSHGGSPNQPAVADAKAR